MDPTEAPANPQDTPAPADTPPQGTGTPEQPEALSTPSVDYEKRYNDLRPEFDRATQEAAQYRQLVDALRSDDPDTRLQAAQALGLEIVEDPPVEYQDPDDQLRAELEDIKQWRQEQSQKAQESERLQQIETHVESQLASISGLKERHKDWIVQRAVHLPPDPNGMPDIAAAHRDWVQFVTEEQKDWVTTKRAPHISQTGTAGTSTPNLDNRQQRVDWITEQLQADQ